MKGFSNPWKISDKSRLYSIASGAPFDIDVKVDVLRAEIAGRTPKKQFIQDCFFFPRRNNKWIALKTEAQHDGSLRQLSQAYFCTDVNINLTYYNNL